MRHSFFTIIKQANSVYCIPVLNCGKGEIFQLLFDVRHRLVTCVCLSVRKAGHMFMFYVILHAVG